jgi:hypothetical protein
MILGSEWTAYHLTPRGWVLGDKQREYAPLLHRPPPNDRVLSMVYKVNTDGNGNKDRSFILVWSSDDPGLVEDLLAKFGPAPAEL